MFESDQEFLSSQGSKLVEKCRLELAATIKIAELAAKYQNLVGKVQFRVKSAKTCAGILEELAQKIESFDLWMEEITERYQKLTETDKKTPPSDHFQNALKEVTGKVKKDIYHCYLYRNYLRIIDFLIIIKIVFFRIFLANFERLASLSFDLTIKF